MQRDRSLGEPRERAHIPYYISQSIPVPIKRVEGRLLLLYFAAERTCHVATRWRFVDAGSYQGSARG